MGQEHIIMWWEENSFYSEFANVEILLQVLSDATDQNSWFRSKEKLHIHTNGSGFDEIFSGLTTYGWTLKSKGFYDYFIFIGWIYCLG